MSTYDKSNGAGIYVRSAKSLAPKPSHHSKAEQLATMEEDERKKRVRTPEIEFQRRRIRVGGETI